MIEYQIQSVSEKHYCSIVNNIAPCKEGGAGLGGSMSAAGRGGELIKCLLSPQLLMGGQKNEGEKERAIGFFSH